jgi:hypothetical protein
MSMLLYPYRRIRTVLIRWFVRKSLLDDDGTEVYLAYSEGVDDTGKIIFKEK